MSGLPLTEIGGGSKAFSFDNIGDKVTGTIVTVERRQQTSIDSGTPLAWDDGSPRMLTYIEVQTDLREGDDDEGVRALYAKGGRNHEPAEGKGTSMEAAIVDAVKKAGADSIDEGAILTVAHSGIAKSQRGRNPAKLYLAKYEPPTASVAVDDLFPE